MHNSSRLRVLATLASIMAVAPASGFPITKPHTPETFNRELFDVGQSYLVKTRATRDRKNTGSGVAKAKRAGTKRKNVLRNKARH